MDTVSPFPAASYFFTKSGSYVVDVNRSGQGPDKANGVYRSISSPSGGVKDNFELGTHETKFYSKDDERSTYSQHAIRQKGKHSLPRPEGNGLNENGQQNSTEQSINADDIDGGGGGAEEKKETKLKFSQMSRRSKYTLFMLAIANFGAGCGYSLPAPFYPREAEMKGASQTAIGLVFSSFQLVNFIACPVIGNYLTFLGAKFVYASGIMVAGCTAILFGFLDKGPSGTIFVVMSFLVRTIEALGVSAFSTASFAIISNEFPNHIASVFATLETCISIGLMVGPTIGGALYEVGGYGLPFWVVGAVIILNGLAIFGCLPTPKDMPAKQQGTVFSLLKSPMVWVTMMCIMVGSSGMGFLDPTLSNHLEQFGLSTILVGLFFVIVPGIYAITAPLWGYLSDTKDIQSPLLIGGSLVCTLGFIFMGPSPLFPFLPKTLWTVTIGLVLYGLCIGCAIVPTMKCMVIGAKDIGFSDNLNTFGLVSGLFNSTYFLGAFIGPTIGGAVVDQIGFYYGSTVIAGFYFITMIVSSIYFLLRRIRHKKSLLADDLAGQDTTKLTPSEKAPTEKAQLISTASKVKGVDNAYTAAVYTQSEVAGQTQTHLTGRTQKNTTGRTQSQNLGQTLGNSTGETQKEYTGQIQENTIARKQTDITGQAKTKDTAGKQTDITGQAKTKDTAGKQTDVTGQAKTKDTAGKQTDITGQAKTKDTAGKQTDITGQAKTKDTARKQTDITGQTKTKDTAGKQTEYTGKSKTKDTAEKQTDITGQTKTKDTAGKQTDITGQAKTKDTARKQTDITEETESNGVTSTRL